MPTPCSSNRSLGGWEYSGSSDLQWISMIPGVFTNRSGWHISNNSGPQKQCYCWLTKPTTGKSIIQVSAHSMWQFLRIGDNKIHINANTSQYQRMIQSQETAVSRPIGFQIRIVELAEQALLTRPSVSRRGSGFFKTAHRQLWASRWLSSLLKCLVFKYFHRNLLSNTFQILAHLCSKSYKLSGSCWRIPWVGFLRTSLKIILYFVLQWCLWGWWRVWGPCQGLLFQGLGQAIQPLSRHPAGVTTTPCNQRFFRCHILIVRQQHLIITDTGFHPLMRFRDHDNDDD